MILNFVCWVYNEIHTEKYHNADFWVCRHPLCRIAAWIEMLECNKEKK